MAIFVRKEDGLQVVARQNDPERAEAFQAWLKTIGINPDVKYEYDWVIYFGEDKYAILDEDEFEALYDDPAENKSSGEMK